MQKVKHFANLFHLLMGVQIMCSRNQPPSICQIRLWQA